MTGHAVSQSTRQKISQKNTLSVNEKEKRSEGKPLQYLHRVLDLKYGKPVVCENKKCKEISKYFNWALKKRHSYSTNKRDYFQLCRSCHTLYDMNENWRKHLSESITNWWNNRKTYEP